MLLIVKVVCVDILLCKKKKKKKIRHQNLSDRFVAKKDLLIICVKIFGTRWCSQIFWRKNKGSHFQFFVENVARGNSVQIDPNFPAKSLSTYFNEFFSDGKLLNWLKDLETKHFYYLLIVWNNLRRKIKITLEHCWVWFYLITTIYKYE